MPDNNEGVEINEMAQIMHNTARNYDDISKKTFDAYDKLIAEIILIEKMHKYGSTGSERKLKEIEKQINRFINTDDFGD
jgi:septation ring formation regulator EzrA